MICTWYLAWIPLVTFQNCVKLRITISKYHSWYLCQISLQIMLLPIQISITIETDISNSSRINMNFMYWNITDSYQLPLIRYLLNQWKYWSREEASRSIYMIETETSCVLKASWKIYKQTPDISRVWITFSVSIIYTVEWW